MAQGGPSTRFRTIALTILAAGGVFLPVGVLAVSSLGLLPTPGTAETLDPAVSNDQSLAAVYGASGILPQASELSPALLADITSGGDPPVAIPEGALTIPPVAQAAYQRAEAALALQEPDCRVSWPLLAGLGRVVSDHGGSSLDPSGNSTRPILGPRLDGSPGLASIRDTDGGRLDGDAQWDRASGPMQIIPSVWRRVGADSDGDGFGSPHNVFDSALAAGRYLCEDGATLTEVADQAQAAFRYQRSEVFVRAVMAWTLAYGPRVVPSPAPSTLPPVQQIKPKSATPPPAGSMPQGEPQAPSSAVPTPGVPRTPGTVVQPSLPPAEPPLTEHPPSGPPPSGPPPSGPPPSGPSPSDPPPSGPPPSGPPPSDPPPSGPSPSGPPSSAAPTVSGPPSSDPLPSDASSAPPTKSSRSQTPAV